MKKKRRVPPPKKKKKIDLRERVFLPLSLNDPHAVLGGHVADSVPDQIGTVARGNGR